MDFESGWISGSCSGDDPGWYLPRLESANPDGVDGADSAVDDSWTTATQWWLTDGHLPLRPTWTCRECPAVVWPCAAARSALASALSRRTLAVVMAEWMHLAAGELEAVKPAALFDRYLLWTRR